MDETQFNESPRVLSEPARRRDALRSLSAAGMALLATLGLANGSDAKKNNGGNNHKHRTRDKNRDQHKSQAERKGGGGGGKGKPGPAGSSEPGWHSLRLPYPEFSGYASPPPLRELRMRAALAASMLRSSTS